MTTRGLDAPDENAPHTLLVTTEWVAAHQGDQRLVLVDVSESVAYERAHIAGAVGVPREPWFKSAEDCLHVLTGAEFEQLARGMGVSDDSQVVMYDSARNRFAARGWWVFKRHGFEAVRILDGGLHTWLAEGRPVTQDVPRPARGNVVSRLDDTALCSLEDVRAAVESGTDGSLWDIRTDNEWTGASRAGNRRAGRLPGARHLEWVHLVDDTPAHRLLPLDVLRGRLEAAGIHPERIEVVYCQIGIRASLGTFVLRMLGNDRARMYDASMAEWANRDDTPLVR